MASTQAQPLPPRPKKKPLREVVLEEMIEYHRRPNQKLLKDLREKCALNNIKFEPMFNKAKELQMKEKAENKLTNPANVDSVLAKRVNFGNKLIENLKAMPNPPPYSDSILEAARYNKMRILEAHISNYSDSNGIREQRIN